MFFGNQSRKVTVMVINLLQRKKEYNFNVWDMDFSLHVIFPLIKLERKNDFIIQEKEFLKKWFHFNIFFFLQTGCLMSTESKWLLPVLLEVLKSEPIKKNHMDLI